MYKISLALLTLVLLAPSVLLAQATVASPERFQQVISVPAVDVLVPTVVEIALPPMEGEKAQFLVQNETRATFVPSLYQKTYDVEPVPYVVTVDGQALSALTDAAPSTVATFPVPAEGGSTIELLVNAASAFTASSFVLDLATNVALPQSIAVYAEVDGFEQTVLATVEPRSNIVQFPAVSAAVWRIVVSFAQPLRLEEVRFSQDDVEATVSHRLRFLAQPDTAYLVYLYPEIYTEVGRQESGNLQGDEDVLALVTEFVSTANPVFTFADSDADTIPDRLDNCVEYANPDQIDLNQNDKGDACEDFDKDGVMNPLDNCQNEPNRNQLDEDGDGIGDVCDGEESRVTEKYAWIPWVAMGGALLLFALLFAIVLRRLNNQPTPVTQTEPIKPPVSDTEKPRD